MPISNRDHSQTANHIQVLRLELEGVCNMIFFSRKYCTQKKESPGPIEIPGKALYAFSFFSKGLFPHVFNLPRRPAHGRVLVMTNLIHLSYGGFSSWEPSVQQNLCVL